MTLDEMLASNFMDITYSIRNLSWDWLNVNSGIERGGKSDFGLSQAWWLSHEGGMKFDWSPAMSNVFFYEPAMAEKMMTVPDESVVIIDEGGETLFSRKAMKREVSEIIQTLMRYGSKRIFLIINIPDWRWIDRYIRTSRVRSLIKIKTKAQKIMVDGRLTMVRERGFYRFYTRNMVKRASKKKEHLGDPAFFGVFESFGKEHPEEYAWYKAKKDAFLVSSGERLTKERLVVEAKESKRLKRKPREDEEFE